jgi:ABC-type dipeptide/oligopeptide/nickel transport system ATPase component
MLLEVQDLAIEFQGTQKKVQAVDHISFNIKKGEIVGLVGESGSGKSVTALSILNLIEKPGRITSGQIIWKEQNLLTIPINNLRKIRGREIAMIFQDPYGSLNPVYPVGQQIAEVLELHKGLSKSDAMKEAISLLEKVKITDAKNRINDYPHQFSGGMCQRVMIAMALACRPELLIADEPTTALDVTIQAEIMQLLLDLQKELGMAIFLISHDLPLISKVCDRVLVMQNGKIVEEGGVDAVYKNPKHAYTQKLLQTLSWKK